MHPALLSSLRRIEDHLRADSRCVAAVLAGSMGTGTADEHSDVDVAAVLRDDAFDGFCAELRPLVERLCGPIVAWLPEGATADSCNFAFLFRDGPEVLLYDFYVVRQKVASQLAGPQYPVLFDKVGCLTPAGQAAPAAPFTAASVRTAVDTWWVYAYLNGKYLRRGDVYKLVYVQDVLFQTHLRLLNAVVEPDAVWTWWARDIKRLPEPARERMLVYFGAVQPDEIRAALRTEMDLFARDAREACDRWQVAYPAVTEEAVRGHLRAAGV